MNKKTELIASYWTLAGAAYPHTDREYSPFEFRDRVEAIARAGFKGMGIWHADLDHTLEKRSLREMKQILDDNDIHHVELEFLGNWFLEGEKKEASDIRKQKLFTAAEALGAHHIKVGDFYNTTTPMPRLITSFAALCEEATAYGTKIGFEMMPFAMLQTLEETMEMIEGANEPNGGIIFDLWHIVKMKIPYETVAKVPRDRIIGIEINDGYIESDMDMVEETTMHRQLCGEGEFDVQGFVDAMLASGYDGPWGIEVLNAEFRERRLEELATRSFDTTIAFFDQE